MDVKFLLRLQTDEGAEIRQETRLFGFVFGLDNVAHEDGVPGIGNDEKEEWMINT